MEYLGSCKARVEGLAEMSDAAGDRNLVLHHSMAIHAILRLRRAGHCDESRRSGGE